MDLSTIVYILGIGAFSGWAAGTLMKGRGYGLLVNIALGVIGAIVGGFVFDFFGLATNSLGSLLVSSVIGSIIVISIAGFFKRRL